MKFVSNRDMTVETTSGHCLFFAKDTPTHAPDFLRSELLDKGLQVHGDDAKPSAAQSSADERQQLILAAFEELAQANDANDFTAAGVPTAKALARVSGLSDVSAAEREGLWLNFKDSRQA